MLKKRILKNGRRGNDVGFPKMLTRRSTQRLIERCFLEMEWPRTIPFRLSESFDRAGGELVKCSGPAQPDLRAHPTTIKVILLLSTLTLFEFMEIAPQKGQNASEFLESTLRMWFSSPPPSHILPASAKS